jgi:hypothetical protein
MVAKGLSPDFDAISRVSWSSDSTSAELFDGCDRVDGILDLCVGIPFESVPIEQGTSCKFRKISSSGCWAWACEYARGWYVESDPGLISFNRVSGFIGLR